MKCFWLLLLSGLSLGCTNRRPAAHSCSSVELRWSIGQKAGQRPHKSMTAQSPCRGRVFSDASGRTWKTDAQGYIGISRLQEEWVTWPTPSTRMLDAFVASWLFEHGYHYLAARQWVSLLLESPAEAVLPHFCGWWDALRREGGNWERMMAMLPLAAFRNGSQLVAASPRHGFLLRLPGDWNVREKSLDAATSLWVITRPHDDQNPLLVIVSSVSAPAVETILGLPDSIHWHPAERNGWRAALIEGKTWMRRDEEAFGHHHVWLAAPAMHPALDRFDSMESFSMVDPCAAPAEPSPEPEP